MKQRREESAAELNEHPDVELSQWIAAAALSPVTGQHAMTLSLVATSAAGVRA
jgi:hypothetical protein